VELLSGNLREKDILNATGISRHTLKRRREQGLVLVASQSHGRGRGKGKTPLEYPPNSVATIRRLIEILPQFRTIEECRWWLWCEGYSVRIAPDLADTLDQIQEAAQQINTLSDIETKIPASLLKPTNLPPGHLLRTIFRGLSDDYLHSLTALLICFCLGIKLPLFDEPNPNEFRVFKTRLRSSREMATPARAFRCLSEPSRTTSRRTADCDKRRA
jgi:hypothetical protein